MQLQTISIADKINTISKVIAWEDFAKSQPQLELQVNNYFSYGVYARELLIPADTILTGEIHKFENLNILTKGKIKVLIGDNIEIIEAPYIVVSPAGTKRIAHTITDCVWVTIHGTHERDVDKIKDQFIAEELNDYLSMSKQLELPLWHG